MKNRSLLYALSFLLLLFFSCHSYNKITYIKADSNKTKKEKITSEKKVSIAEDEEPYFTDKSEKNKGDSAILSTDEQLDEVAVIPKLTEKKFKTRAHRILAKEREKVQELKGEIFVSKQSKSKQIGKANDGTSDGMSIFLTIVLILLILVIVIFLILLITLAQAVGSGGSSCYVATMAYGDNNAPEVISLRAYRDQHLMKSVLGRKFITGYYKYSPGFVERHQSKLWLHKICRRGLNVLVFFLRKIYTLK
jgi:hypothetical protein